MIRDPNRRPEDDAAVTNLSRNDHVGEVVPFRRRELNRPQDDPPAPETRPTTRPASWSRSTRWRSTAASPAGRWRRRPPSGGRCCWRGRITVRGPEGSDLPGSEPLAPPPASASTAASTSQRSDLRRSGASGTPEHLPAHTCRAGSALGWLIAASPASGHGASLGSLMLLGLVAVAGYVAACAWWPLTRCGKCSGAGKLRSPGRKAWRKCPRCKGSGEKIRAGRRLWTYATSTRAKGQR